MPTQSVTRRQFAASLGAAFALATTRDSFVLGAAQHERPQNAPAGAIQLDFNENPYGPSPKACAAITDSESHAMRYPDAAQTVMEQDIARLHGVDVENVLLGCGSSEVLRAADMAFLGADKNIVAAEPTFEAVLAYARITRAEPIKVPLTADGRHDLERMAAQCTSRTGVVYLCNPNNPTATIVTRDDMARFCAAVPKTTMILVDEAYHHFVDDPRYVSATEWLGKMPNLIVARTFSKVYALAGMRLGYAVASTEAIKLMRRQVMAASANAAVLAAGHAALQDTDHVSRCRERILATRTAVVSRLQAHGFHVFDSQANFFMVDTRADVRPAIEEFKKRGVLVGRKFPSLPNYLRVTVGTDDEMRVFASVFEEIYCGANTCAMAS
ncbi:MAG TPA: histidinol-phosphate transaminase [Candidatus Acidoferrales bacterium]|nr:histidinol-phosphate transaminase [Candidatus Acidoferrales bacterium]